MKKSALISGRACSAFLLHKDGTWTRLRYETPDVEEPCSQFEVEYALQGCSDVATIEITRKEEALKALFDAVDLTEAVDLTVWLIDGTLSDETRRSSADELDELLAYAEIRKAWEEIFLNRKMPEDVDVRKAIGIAQSVSATHVVPCLSSLPDTLTNS